MEISLKRQKAAPPKGTHLVHLPVRTITVLRQMRTKFREESLDELAESIKSKGQMNPGVVVALSKEEALQYLECINETWGTKHLLRSFTPVRITEKGEAYYLFLVAGERRLRACKRVRLDSYLSYLRFDLSFIQAIEFQAQENLHEQLAPEESAASFALIWRSTKKIDPSMSLASFARKMGKTPEAIRRAVRFMSLPTEVQELVMPSKEFKRGVPYTTLTELARLQEAQEEYGAPLSTLELIKWAYVLIAQHKSPKEVAKVISERIRSLAAARSGAQPLFSLEIQEVVEGTKRKTGNTVEQTVLAGADHVRRVVRFHRHEAIGKVTSGSAARAVQEAQAVVEELAPQIILGTQQKNTK